jgi:two-component system sensor histidine kinase MprB
MPAEERVQLRADLLSQLRELTALVGDLVELARERPPESDLEELDLASLVASCVERVRSRGSDVRFELSLEASPVRADRARLERAVNNLLDNARKWSPPGTAVEVEVRQGELIVRDEGPGIAEADRPYVFDRFYRSAESRRLPGSGLGLAIVRQVAEMHGGAAWAAPRRDGRSGAELHLRLPALPAGRPPTAVTSRTGPTAR